MKWNSFATAPPIATDFFVKLSDGTFSVAYRNGVRTFPSNVQGCEDCDELEFDSEPISWALIPKDF